MKEPRSFSALLRKAIANPGPAFGFAMARFRGEFYRRYLPMRGRRFRAGVGLQVHGRLKVWGTGEVIFGDNVQVYDLVTPWTYQPSARISIGDNTVLSGTKFGCHQSIEIGSDCIVANCRIMDTDFHSVRADRHEDDAPVRVAPIAIHDNAWIAAETALLPGTQIGKNSVVSFGSICSREYPADVIIVGNPARVAGKLPDASDDQ